ncbi:MAG: DUF2461 domain-containing protein [Gemmatimonadaceae bacterium]
MPFSPDSLRFLRGLAKNNNKTWFEAHRADYEGTVREPMRELIEELDARFGRFAPEIGGDPKRSMFRINRDIRFSNDKSPYKTGAACWFHHRNAASKVGAEANAGSAGFYFHLEPGKCMIGAGLWMPPRPQLNRLRERIADDSRGFERMVKSIPKRFGGLSDEAALKRMPQGYSDEHPAAKWLRFRSFTSGRTLTDASIIGPRLPALLEKDFAGLLPLVRWLNDALGFPEQRRR